MNAATPSSSADDPSDPNAPLPPDAPFYVRAWYVQVQELIDGLDDVPAQQALQEIWDWMTTHVPERFLRPTTSGRGEPKQED